MPTVTRHASRRTRERLGIPKKAVDANAEKAMRYGVHRWEVHNGLRRYLDYLFHQSNDTADIILYHRNVYIFQNAKLITVMNLPKKYNDRADKVERKRRGDMEEVSNA